MPLDSALSRNRMRSSARSRMDNLPFGANGSGAATTSSIVLSAGIRVRTRRLSSADSDMPCARAQAPNRSLTSRGTQVMRCLLSLAMAAMLNQTAAVWLSCICVEMANKRIMLSAAPDCPWCDSPLFTKGPDRDFHASHLGAGHVYLDVLARDLAAFAIGIYTHKFTGIGYPRRRWLSEIGK
jgi:hypothetical protein